MLATLLGTLELLLPHEHSGAARVPSRSAEPAPQSAAPARVAMLARIKEPARELQLVGRVKSSAGRDLWGATVCTVPRIETCYTAAACAVTDARGEFELSNVGDAATVVASAPGYQPLARPISSLTGAGRVLRLEPGGAELSGSVMDASGGPVPFATVTVHGASNAVTSVALADADGQFRTIVFPGQQEIIARADGFSAARERVIAPARGIIVELGPGSEIDGRVLNAATSEPLPGVMVSAERLLNLPWDTGGLSREPRASATTDASGAFRFAGLRGGANYVVQLDDARWASDLVPVTLDVGAASTPLVIAARSATSVAGTVFSGAGVCTQGEVQLAGARWVRGTINEEGAIRFQSVEPGHYSVDVYCANALPYHEEIDVGAEALAREWRVQAGFRVSGFVVGSDGQPFAGAHISVGPSTALSDDATLAECASSADGSFSCAGLRPGEYDCSVSEPLDAEAEVAHLVLQDDSVANVVLHLRPMATLRVRLRTSAEGSASGTRVFARGPSGIPVSPQLVGDEFVFENLLLGRYQVYANEPASAGDAANLELSQAGQVYALALTPPRSSTISGFAVDEGGEPVPDTWVKASSSDPLTNIVAAASAREVLTDENGAFALLAARGGTYDLRAQNGFGAGERLGVAAGSTEVILRMARSAAVRDGE